MANSVARHHVQLVADTSQFEKGIQSSSTALARFEKAQKSAARGSGTLGGSQATLAISKEMAAETNRVAVAQQQIFDNLGLRLPQAAKSAEASFASLNLEIERGNKALKRSEMAMGGMGNAMSKGSKGASRFGMMIQQGGYQVQDFAVQVGGGQSALTALAQQGSQFAGIFGAKGAVFGAALAIGAVVAKMVMLKSEVSEIVKEFKTLDEIAESLLESSRKIAIAKASAKDDSIEVASIDIRFDQHEMDKVQKQYAEEAKKLQDIENKIKLGPQTGGMGLRLGGKSRDGLKEYNELLKEQKDLVFTLSAIGAKLNEHESKRIDNQKALKDAQEKVAEADGQAAADMADTQLRAQIEADKIVAANKAANDRKASEEAAEREKVNNEKIEEAKELGENLRKSVRTPKEVYLEEIAEFQKMFQVKTITLETYIRLQAKAADEIMQLANKEGEKLRESLRTPEEIYREEIAKFQDMFNAKEITLETYTRAQAEAAEEMFEALAPDKVKDKMTEFEKISTRMWNSVSDRASQSFADMVLTGETAFDKLAEIVARAMLEIAARMAIVNPLMNLLGANALGGSLLPAWFGAGKVATTATGGSIWKGETRMVGEAGPELITAQKGGQIMANSARKSSNSAPIYNLNYTFNGGVTPQDLGRAIPQIVQMTKRAVSESNSRWQPV